MSDNIFFLSDSHFKYHTRDSHEREKRTLFISFMRYIEGSARLYLVGDIFDFWFEYRSVIPRYYGDVLASIGNLAASGTEIYMTGGNHDYWLGSYLSDTFGIKILGDCTVHSLQGRSVKITHGDGLVPGDRGYKALKALIRSRFAVAAARLLHPDILYSLAAGFSRTSKGFTQRKTREYADRLTGAAEERFFRSGNDALVIGHIHLPVLRDFGGKTFIILGDWDTHFSYAKLENGIFTLEKYQKEGNTLSENL